MPVLIIIMLFSCLQTVYSKASINIALSSNPSALNPFFSTDSNSQNINRLVHISLTDFNESMDFTCHLCQTFSEKIIDGKHHIYFKLRQDVKFWDNGPVTAYDVEKSVKYFTEEKIIKSIFRFAFRKIKKVVVHSKYEVEFVYDHFTMENISNLTLLKIVKLKQVKKKAVFEDIIGAGAYRFLSIKPLAVSLVPTRDNLMPTLQFKVVKDETTLALKLINKEIDLSLANISPRKYLWLKKEGKKDLKFWERASTNYKYIGINHKKEYLKDVRVRKALSMLIPRADILKYKLKKTAVLATSMFSPAFAGMYQELPLDKYNPKKAKNLLLSAGFKLNEKNIFEKDNKPLTLDWKVSNNKAAREMIETISGYFKKAGVQVVVTGQEWGTYMRSFKSGKYDIVLAQWIGFTGPEMLKSVFHSASIPPKGLNRGYYINKELDDLIDSATTVLEKVKRNNYYKLAQNLAFKDYAYINLWHPNVVWIGRKCLTDIKLHPNGSFYPLLNIKKKCVN